MFEKWKEKYRNEGRIKEMWRWVDELEDFSNTLDSLSRIEYSPTYVASELVGFTEEEYRIGAAWIRRAINRAVADKRPKIVFEKITLRHWWSS